MVYFKVFFSHSLGLFINCYLTALFQLVKLCPSEYSTVQVEKLMVNQLFNKFHTFYETQSLVAEFTYFRNEIQSKLSNPIFKLIVILSSQLHLQLQSVLFPMGRQLIYKCLFISLAYLMHLRVWIAQLV
jgi:hypothetical protein